MTRLNVVGGPGGARSRMAQPNIWQVLDILGPWAFAALVAATLYAAFVLQRYIVMRPRRTFFFFDDRPGYRLGGPLTPAQARRLPVQGLGSRSNWKWGVWSSPDQPPAAIPREGRVLAAATVSHVLLRVDWAALAPRARGSWDKSALRKLWTAASAWRTAGVEPTIVLASAGREGRLPAWFTAAGSWEADEAPQAFAELAIKVGQTLGPLAASYLTVASINAVAIAGWVTGRTAPRSQSLSAAFRVACNLLDGHKAAYEALHRLERPAGSLEVSVGASLAVTPFEPKSPLWVGDILAASALRNGALDAWVAALAGRSGSFSVSLGSVLQGIHPTPELRTDFLGLDWYGPAVVSGRLWGLPAASPASGRASYINSLFQVERPGRWPDTDPGLLYGVLERVARSTTPGLPLLLTAWTMPKLGLEPDQDNRESESLCQTVVVVSQAKLDGLPLAAFFLGTPDSSPLRDSRSAKDLFTTYSSLIHASAEAS